MYLYSVDRVAVEAQQFTLRTIPGLMQFLFRTFSVENIQLTDIVYNSHRDTPTFTCHLELTLISGECFVVIIGDWIIFNHQTGELSCITEKECMSRYSPCCEENVS